MLRNSLLCLIFLLVPSLALAGVPWDRVIGADASALSADDKARAEKLMDAINVYYGCSDTVSKCLGSDPECQTARRIAGIIVRLVRAGRSDKEIRAEVKERALSAHPFKTHEFNLKKRPAYGAPEATAKVTVVEFADFECPFCRTFSPALKKAVTRLQDKGVRLVFKHFPVSVHTRAVASGRAAYAVHKQGKFWEYHDLLYQKAPKLSDSALGEYARSIGVDMEAFEAVRGSERSELVVASDKKEGLRAGCEGTPTIFVNGKLYRGRKELAEFADRLEEELHLVGGGR